MTLFSLLLLPRAREAKSTVIQLVHVRPSVRPSDEFMIAEQLHLN